MKIKLVYGMKILVSKYWTRKRIYSPLKLIGLFSANYVAGYIKTKI